MQRRAMFRNEAAANESSASDVLASITDEQIERQAAKLVSAPAGTPSRGQLDAVVAAERSLVGAILADNRSYDLLLDVLRAGDFADPVCAAVFSAVADVVEGRNKALLIADPVSLASLPGIAKLASLDQLTQLAASGCQDDQTLLTRANVVKNASNERGLTAAASRIQEIAGEEKSFESKSTEILRLLAGTTEVQRLPIVSMGDAAIQAVSELAQQAQSGNLGIKIPFGFRDLDALTAGMHPGQLIVIAARPGIGKTAFTLSVALNAAASGVNVLLASMEMKAPELSRRALSIVSGVDAQAIRVGALSESEWEQLAGAAEYLTQLPFDVVDLPSVDLPGLSGLARRRHREKKLGLLAVDYLQIMKTSGGRGMNREQQIGELTRGLKELGMELGVPVVLLSQLNRGVESRLVKRPQLSDLRESGSIEQDADVVIFIHREDVGSKSVKDESSADIIVEKQRDGPPGEAQVCFLRRQTAFTDYESVPISNSLKAA